MYIWAKVKGDSMSPLFNTDSSVQICLCSIEALRRGDVVVFKEGERLVCHRYFSKTELKGKVFLKVKGDASLGFDPLVESGCFLGKVVYLKRWGISIGLDNFPARMSGLILSHLAPVYIWLFGALKRRLS